MFKKIFQKTGGDGMDTGGVNKGNLILHDKMMQLAKNNNKQARQAIQSHILEAEKTRNSMKDTVEISTEGRERAGNLKNETESTLNWYEEMMRQLESAREQGEAMAEAARVRIKCLIIAARIMSGDKVPREDYRYLAKHDLELYSKAVSLRMEKEDPKKHRRVSEKEKSDDNESVNRSDRTESAKSDNGEIQTQANTDNSETS